MKKLISILLSAALVTGMLAGCGTDTGNETEDGVTEIVIWHDKEDEVAGILQKKLETLEPEIHVTLEKKSDLTESLKMVGNNPKAAPDMYFFAHDKIGVYA